MNLHRSDKTPDWEKEADYELPKYAKVAQSVARRTNGIVTPGNIISAIGLGLTLSGARDVSKGSNVKGSVKIIVGRSLDIVDGIAADKTKTKSALGEAVDATFDKIGMVATLFALYKSDTVPEDRLTKFALQNTANVVATTLAKRNDIELHPSQHGKVTTALQWVSIGSSVVGSNFEAQEHPVVSRSIDFIGDSTALVANSLGTLVSLDYLQTATNINKNQTDELQFTK